MANQWGKAPSDLFHITDELAAYNLDRAVMYFGKWVESEMSAAAKKGKTDKAAQQKAQMALNRCLAEPGEQKFRDPMAARR